MLLQVTADLGRQKDTSSGAEFTILLVQLALKNKFLKVDESHGHGWFLVTTFILGQLSYFPFQAGWRQQNNAKGENRNTEIKQELSC